MSSSRTFSEHCLNCHLPVISAYCASCGQRAHFDPNPRLSDVVHDAWHELLHVDGKIFRTLKTLLFKPGMLTREYLNGRRSRYISPIRLYLTLSVAYFLLNAIFDPSTAFQGDVKFELGKEEATLAQEGVSKSFDLTGWIERNLHIEKPFERVREHPDRATQLFESAYPKALFLLLPLFALILQMSYFFRGRYPQYLYFALHFHAALFAASILLMPFRDSLRLFWFLAGAIYFVIAVRRVWGGSKAAAVARGLVVASAYAVFFVFALLAIFSYTVLKT